MSLIVESRLETQSSKDLHSPALQACIMAKSAKEETCGESSHTIGMAPQYSVSLLVDYADIYLELR
jgi:hypothetical protein